MSKRIFPFVIFLLVIIISACNEEPTQQPTTDPGQIETQIAEQVAEQVAAELTQIALNQPAATITPSPTSNVLPTEAPLLTDTTVPSTEPSSPTATLPPPTETNPPPPASTSTNTVPVPTITFTPAPFACQIVKQVPENGKTYKPNTDFDAVWTVKNIGSEVWDTNEVDYVYDSGDELHKIGGYDLSENVDPGDSIDLVVDMKTPEEEGTYETTWLLSRGSHLLCTLTLEINVEK